MSIKTIKKIKTELLHLIRNSDVLSITDRSVTTATDTGTFTADSSHIISVTNVKNIRSVVVGLTTLSYGTDYLYDVDYDNSGTISCNITFTTAQTGDYTITYDYGTDRIFPDYPDYYKKLSDFPRIGFDIINVNYTHSGLGYTKQNGTMTIQLNAYSHNDPDKIETILASIIDLIKSNTTSGYSFDFAGDYVIGSMLPSPFSKDEIIQRNLDFELKTFYED